MQKNSKILSVDVDGILIKTDIFYETFWSAFANDFLIPAKAFFAFFKGKAFLKEILLNCSSLDIKSLPYNEAVIEYILLHRSNGGKVALVSSSSQQLAYAISEHLDLFDEVYFYPSINKLKGLEKANHLEKYLD